MEVAKLAAPPNLEVRFVSCNGSAIKRWLSSELEATVFSLTHELFMTKHHTVTLTEFDFESCITSWSRLKKHKKWIKRYVLFMIWTGNAIKMGKMTRSLKKKKRSFLEKHNF